MWVEFNSWNWFLKSFSIWSRFQLPTVFLWGHLSLKAGQTQYTEVPISTSVRVAATKNGQKASEFPSAHFVVSGKVSHRESLVCDMEIRVNTPDQTTTDLRLTMSSSLLSSLNTFQSRENDLLGPVSRRWNQRKDGGGNPCERIRGDEVTFQFYQRKDSSPWFQCPRTALAVEGH